MRPDRSEVLRLSRCVPTDQTSRPIKCFPTNQTYYYQSNVFRPIRGVQSQPYVFRLIIYVSTNQMCPDQSDRRCVSTYHTCPDQPDALLGAIMRVPINQIVDVVFRQIRRRSGKSRFVHKKHNQYEQVVADFSSAKKKKNRIDKSYFAALQVISFL